MENNGRFWRMLTIVLMAALICFMVIMIRNQRQNAISVSKEVALSKEWTKLELVLNQIQKNYVDTIDISDFIERSLPALMSELDPHSVYLEPQVLQKADGELQGNIEGIGILFNVPNDTAVVINVVVGGPSERMGLQSGDKIIKVDSHVVAGVRMPQDSMMTLMRGPKGSKVDVWVQRYGAPDLIRFNIERAQVPMNSMDVAYMVNDSTGYVKLSKFARTSYMELLEGFASLLEQGMTRLIFDLRDNTGGYFDQALKISSEFLKQGQLIVYTQGAHRDRQDFHSPKDGILKDIPLAVLIDENSASSSEIMAGALQDNDRGTIIGRRSYGKGLVQEPIYFSDNSGLRLTVSRFYTPLGRSIQKPYGADRTSYDYDILERYRHGEFMQEDSIPKNDSLRYETPNGKVLYGGGGIIPDVFVPMDTVGVNDGYIELVRQNIPIRFSVYFADRHRDQIKSMETMEQLNAFYANQALEQDFLQYAASLGIRPTGAQWKECKSIILTQVKAYVGRHTKMDDKAFYPFFGDIDNVVQKALEVLNGPQDKN